MGFSGFARSVERGAAFLSERPWTRAGAGKRLSLQRQEIVEKWRAALRDGAEAAEAMLCEHGDWLAREPLPNGFRGFNACMVLAASYGDADLWRALLAHGADPSGLDGEGNTTLMAAAGRPHEELARLAAPHCDPKAANRAGDTALSIAARANGRPLTLESAPWTQGGDTLSLETARWLVRASDPKAVNREGQNAMDRVVDSVVSQPFLAQALAEALDPSIDHSSFHTNRARKMGELDRALPPSPLRRAIGAHSWPVVDAFLLSPLMDADTRRFWLRKVQLLGVLSELPRASSTSEGEIQAEFQRRLLLDEISCAPALSRPTAPARDIAARRL